jgi:hypothetical protein
MVQELSRAEQSVDSVGTQTSSALQVSFSVHGFPSVQGSPSFEVNTQVPAEHESSVQNLLSLQGKGPVG